MVRTPDPATSSRDNPTGLTPPPPGVPPADGPPGQPRNRLIIHPMHPQPPMMPWPVSFPNGQIRISMDHIGNGEEPMKNHPYSDPN